MCMCASVWVRALLIPKYLNDADKPAEKMQRAFFFTSFLVPKQSTTESVVRVSQWTRESGRGRQFLQAGLSMCCLFLLQAFPLLMPTHIGGYDRIKSHFDFTLRLSLRSHSISGELGRMNDTPEGTANPNGFPGQRPVISDRRQLPITLHYCLSSSGKEAAQARFFFFFFHFAICERDRKRNPARDIRFHYRRD